MPKWIKSNGAVLEVRDVGPVMFRMEPKTARLTLPAGVSEVMSDKEAKAYLEDLKETGKYTSQAIKTTGD